jgi:hypothetical protein
MEFIKSIWEDLREGLQWLGIPFRNRFPYIGINVLSGYLECLTPSPNIMQKYWPSIVGDFATRAANDILSSADPQGNYTNEKLAKKDAHWIDGDPKNNKFRYGTRRACEIALALGYEVHIESTKITNQVRYFKRPFCLYEEVNILVAEIDGLRFLLGVDSGKFVAPSFSYIRNSVNETNPSRSEIKKVCIKLKNQIRQLIHSAKSADHKDSN